jgi:ATP-dependent Clp protease adaptor protein ClpS
VVQLTQEVRLPRHFCTSPKRLSKQAPWGLYCCPKGYKRFSLVYFLQKRQPAHQKKKPIAAFSQGKWISPKFPNCTEQQWKTNSLGQQRQAILHRRGENQMSIHPPISQLATQIEEEQLLVLRARLGRHWQVILHNDDIHLANDVARWLVESIPGLSTQDAWDITILAHNTGKAIVISCPKEEAELYQERLLNHSLTVTIEPLE